MNRQEEIIEEIEKQLCRVRRELKGYKVFLFGTRAAGVAHKHSDFDIGILGDRPIPLKTFFKIEDLFDSIDTLYTIDWVDLNRASASFREEALKNTGNIMNKHRIQYDSPLDALIALVKQLHVYEM